MTAPRCTELDDVRFLLATPSVFSATEAARVHPYHPGRPAHDAFSRLLERAEPDSAALWVEVKPLVRRRAGVLVIDDTTLDKPYARHIEPVTWHGSGKHHAVVKGIRLVTLLWTDGDRGYPCDFRLDDKSDGKTKNDHFADMLAEAKARGFSPEYVAFDGWYASLANLKAVRGHGWRFLTRLKSNRRVSPAPGQTVALSEAAISAAGTVIHLPGFGSVKVFRLVATNGDTEHWCTDDLEMDEMGRLRVAGLSWDIEVYHGGIKQHTGVERCRSRSADAQRVHVGCALRAFVRLQYRQFIHGITWFESKLEITRDAVRFALSRPLYELPLTA